MRSACVDQSHLPSIEIRTRIIYSENRMDMDARRRIVNRSYDEEREREDELIGGMVGEGYGGRKEGVR